MREKRPLPNEFFIIPSLNKLFDEIYQFQSFIQDGIQTFGTWKWGVRYYFKSMWNSLDFATCALILGPIPLFHILSVVAETSKFRTALSVTVALQAILMSIKVRRIFQRCVETGRIFCFSGLVLCTVLPPNRSSRLHDYQHLCGLSAFSLIGCDHSSRLWSSVACTAP